MADNDNSVNIESASFKSLGRGYHHGDLRASLIAAGLGLLEQRTADDLSLREVARVVGVSATAVYRHFPDKQALLYALCEQGAQLLADAQRDAMAASGGGQKGFEATGRAYVRFALVHPSLFRLMMKTRPTGKSLEDSTAVNVALQVLRANVGAILPGTATAEQRRLVAIRAWSIVHGIAMLMLDGQLPHDEKLVEALLRMPHG